MSIIGKAVEFLTPDTSADVLDKPIDALDKATAKAEEKLKKLFECPPGEKILFINHLPYARRDRFNVDVYDSPKNIKYTIKDELISIKRHLHVFDSTGKEIGLVKEKLLTLRRPAIMQINPTDFDFIIHGKKVATLKSRCTFSKTKYTMNNGWIIEGDFFGLKYSILSERRVVGRINMKPLWGDTYLLTFSECENEVLMLMVVLTIDIYKSAARTEAL